MIKEIGFVLAGVLFVGCVQDHPVSDAPETTEKKTSNNGLSDAENAIQPLKTIVDKKRFLNGIQIQWFEKGKGPALETGNMYELNYKVKLDDGTIVDGNHLLKKDWIPYLYGYNLQTPGWDMALNELHEGDFVEIYLPAKFARGEKGIPGVIPPNAANILFLRVGKKIAPTKTVDGVKVWVHERNDEMKDAKIGDASEVAIDYFVGTKTNPRYDNSYQRNTPFTFRMTDASLVPGLKLGLKGIQLYDKCTLLVPASKAYGSRGYVDLVKPNEEMVYELFIADVDRKSIQAPSVPGKSTH